MKKLFKNLSSYFYILFSILFFESFIMLAGESGFRGKTLLYSALFSSAYVLIIFLITTIIKNKIPGFILQLLFLIFLTVFYAAEFFSRAFFHNYMSIESMAAGGKGIFSDFWGATVEFISGRWYFALILLVPLILYIILYIFKVVNPGKVKAPARLISLGLTLILFCSGLTVVEASATDSIQYNENYEFDSSSLSFGLSTAIRLDAEYLAFGHGRSEDFDLEFAATETSSDPKESPDVTDAGLADAGADSPDAGLSEAGADTPDTALQKSESDTPDNSQSDIDQKETGADPSKSTANGRDLEETDADHPEPEPRVLYPHEVGLDFETLAENEPDSRVAKIDRYIASLTPSMENEYTGLFEGKNVIFITAEAFSGEVISEDLTPTLYRLATKGINFNNYYQPVWGGSTSTGEFSNLTGLIPAYGVASMKMTIYNNNYYTIGNHLMRQSYFSRAYHAHAGSYYDRNLTHENLGYEKFIARGSGLEDYITARWPESDLELMEATVDDYINEQPFSIYYMTVSGHTNYNWAGNAMSGKNRDAVEDLDRPTPVKAYLAANLEFEYAMEYLVNRLEEAGIADDTVIVIGTDHYPFGLEQEKSSQFKNALGDLYGYDYYAPWERDHSRLIIWSGCLEDSDPIVVDDPVYSLDIVPTLLNLLGIPFDSRLYVGRDVFSDQMPLVIWANYNWMTDKACFCGGQGVVAYEGYEDEITKEYIQMISSTVANKFVFSKAVLDYDYYNILFGSK